MTFYRKAVSAFTEQKSCNKIINFIKHILLFCEKRIKNLIDIDICG